jgi:hypothetical protein
MHARISLSEWPGNVLHTSHQRIRETHESHTFWTSDCSVTLERWPTLKHCSEASAHTQIWAAN